METYGKLLIKIDMLSVEAMDKIHNCLDLLCNYGYIERKPTLRETYNDTIGIYNLERTDPKMWDMVLKHKIGSLFQMEQQSGIQGIALAQPKSVDELAVLNSVIRLMASEPGAEQPLNMWARYRKNINEWYREMREYGLDEDAIYWLSHHNAIVNGVCESQEGLMSLLQEPQLGDNDLSFADKCRKAIAKKQGKLFDECEKFYFENAQAKNCDMTLVHYVWDVMLKVQRGYSFCRAHTLAYSLVALQEMNLAYRFPIIFWNCACLITDAGGNETEDEEEEDLYVEKCDYSNEMEEFSEDDEEESGYEEEDCDGYPAEVIITESGKKKKKVKTTNYGKISTAIGKFISNGIKVSTPDINESTYTFSPDVENNMIRYGLSGITRIGDELIKTIIANRPYKDINDFIARIKVAKPQMINLIKAGVFDNFGDRYEIMKNYIASISDTKSTLNMRNCQMLIAAGLIPDKYDFERRLFAFNKYINANCRDAAKINYIFDERAYKFYSDNFDVDLLNVNSDNKQVLSCSTWKKIYDKKMLTVKQYIKDNEQELLNKVNECAISELWNKYCLGNLSSWEMDSISCYYHEHELANVKNLIYDIVDFNKLNAEPIIDKMVPMQGRNIPIYKLSRIVGTVLDRDKNKNTVSLLTTTGVVNVKIYKNQFALYDKQISVRGADGKKHVIEKSWFKRGNKLMIMGIRRDDQFIPKKYKSTPGSVIALITSINDDGTLEYRTERMGE